MFYYLKVFFDSTYPFKVGHSGAVFFKLSFPFPVRHILLTHDHITTPSYYHTIILAWGLGAVIHFPSLPQVSITVALII